MKVIDFLTSLDGFVRQQVANRNQILYILAIADILRYISGEPMDYGLRDFVRKDKEEWEYREESDYCWCGVDKSPYGFTIKEYQGIIMDIEEMAYFLWEVLYRLDENGNEVMGETDGFEYATNAYENLDVKTLGKKYQKLSDMLTGCDIVNCIYEEYEEIFSFAHNMEETLILLDLIINSSGDLCNECGCLEKHILSLESPALDAWVEFMSSESNKVAKEDAEEFRTILTELENEEITYETANTGIELSSFSTGVNHYGGWYRTIIHDTYCFYNSCGVDTSYFFVHGLISLRYLALMLSMQDFLRKMDGKYHYCMSRGNRGEVNL